MNRAPALSLCSRTPSRQRTAPLPRPRPPAPVSASSWPHLPGDSAVRILTVRARREHRHRHACRPLDEFEVLDHLVRQGPSAAQTTEVAPAWHVNVDRTAIRSILDAHLDAVEARQDVELGHDQTIEAVELAGIAQLRQVEPADAPCATGGRAVFVPLVDAAASQP